MCGENYKIVSEDGMVQAFSKKRIPYQPQGWRKELRDALQCALSELNPPAENQCLIASYSGKQNEFFDLENVLFYSIGAASFRQIATNRIFAKNCSQQTLNESNKESEFPYRYTYKIRDSQTCNDVWVNHVIAAEWEPVSISASFSKNKAIDYWRALREDHDKIKLYQRIPDGLFGIKIKLSVPKAKTVNLTTVVKPLLDGVICAFHSADYQLQEESSLIAARLGVSAQQFLCTDTDILGEHRFIYPYRGSSVKWNPQDDRCVAFEIEVERNDDGECSFSGEIYK